MGDDVPALSRARQRLARILREDRAAAAAAAAEDIIIIAMRSESTNYYGWAVCHTGSTAGDLKVGLLEFAAAALLPCKLHYIDLYLKLRTTDGAVLGNDTTLTMTRARLTVSVILKF